MNKTILISKVNDEKMFNKAIVNLMDIIPENIECSPIEDETPIAWDTENPLIKDNQLILEGGFGPSGYGKVKIEIPLEDADKYYSFSFYVNEDSDTIKVIIDMLNKSGAIIQ